MHRSSTANTTARALLAAAATLTAGCDDVRDPATSNPIDWPSLTITTATAGGDETETDGASDGSSDGSSSGEPDDDGKPDDNSSKGEDTGESTGDETTAPDPIDPSTTGTTGTTGGTSSEDTGDEPACKVDVVLVTAVVPGTYWPLQRLAAQVVPADDGLRAAGVDVRWGLRVHADVAVPVDIGAYGGDPDAYALATAVGWWASAAFDGLQPSHDGSVDADPGASADLAALVAAAQGGPPAASASDGDLSAGWREGAARVVVLVTDSAVVEPPAVLSGYPVEVTYAQTVDALEDAEVHVLAWAPDAPGYSSGRDSLPSIAEATSGEWHPLSSESSPDLNNPAPAYATAITAAVLAACP
jgi:hypothetical protein